MWTVADDGWIIRSRLELASLLVCGVAFVWLCVRFAAGHHLVLPDPDGTV